MRRIGLFLILVAILTLIFAWTYNFHGDVEIRSEMQGGVWVEVSRVDSRTPTRHGFSLAAGGIFLAGALLVALPNSLFKGRTCGN